jgi:tripartite-type tricarboxylate transporter receptor subunit TctC
MFRRITERTRFARTVVACAFASLACATPSLAQQARLVSGFPPGGSIDALARIYVDEISREAGRTFIVDTRPGAGGLIAVQNLLASPADGNTILLSPDSNIVAYPHTVKKPAYDGTRDVIPIGFAGTYEMALATKADPAVPDLKAWLARAKADKNMAAFSSPGAGTLPHFFGVLLAGATGQQLLHVPYKGTGPAITDTLGANIAGVISPTATMLGFSKQGALRILATSGSKRSSRTQDIPTFREAGYPTLDFTGWFAFFVHANTPAAEVARLNGVINRVVKKPDVLQRLANIDIDTRETTTAELQALIREENERWKKVIQASGFTADSN